MSGISLQKGDATQNIFLCNTHSTLLFFTNSGKVHATKAYEIPQKKRSERGRAIVNFLRLDEDKVATTIPLDISSSNKFLFMVTKRGIVKKTPVDKFSHLRQGGIIAIRLREADELIKVLLTSGEDEIILSTKKGMSIRFSEEDVRPMGRVSTGVKGITLSEEDVVIDAVVLEDGADLFAITTKGYGKRTSFSKYRRIRRGGKGVKNIKLHPKRGLVVATKKIKKGEEMLIIITREGKSIRVQTKNIRRIGRITAGVRIIKVDKSDEVIGIT